MTRAGSSEEDDSSSLYRAELVESDARLAQQLQDEEYKWKEMHSEQTVEVEQSDDDDEEYIHSTAIGSSTPPVSSPHRHYHHHPTASSYVSPILPPFASPSNESSPAQEQNESSPSVLRRLTRSPLLNRERQSRRTHRYGAISTQHPFHRAPIATPIQESGEGTRAEGDAADAEENEGTWSSCFCCWRW